MKISMDCICRGSGKVYVLLKNVEIDASNIQVTAAKSEGTTIPSSIYPYESNKNQYVVVLPDLGTGDCDIQINDLSARCVYDVIKISFSTAKWASRLNYKLKNDLSHSIRNYDDKHDLDVASMRFHEFIEDGDEAILRCSVKLPQREDNKIAISCFDTSMNRIEIEPITTDDITIPLWFAPNKKRREIQYSVRIPNSTNRLIFTIEDDNHPSFNSFAVVDNEELDKLRILTTSKMNLFRLIHLHIQIGSSNTRQARRYSKNNRWLPSRKCLCLASSFPYSTHPKICSGKWWNRFLYRAMQTGSLC